MLYIKPHKKIISYAIELIPETVDLNNSYENLFNAVESDYFMLYQAKSVLPIENIGNGVFAKHKIIKGSIICEYRGK